MAAGHACAAAWEAGAAGAYAAAWSGPPAGGPSAWEAAWRGGAGAVGADDVTQAAPDPPQQRWNPHEVRCRERELGELGEGVCAMKAQSGALVMLLDGARRGGWGAAALPMYVITAACRVGAQREVRFYNGTADRLLVVTLNAPPEAMRRLGVAVAAGSGVERALAVPQTALDDALPGGEDATAEAVCSYRLAVPPGATKTMYSYTPVSGAAGRGERSISSPWGRGERAPQAAGGGERPPFAPQWTAIALPADAARAATHEMHAAAAEERTAAEGFIRKEICRVERPQEAALHACAAARRPFVDMWFPPHTAGAPEYPLWLRPQHIAGGAASGPPRPLSEQVSPMLLDRGPLGDCAVECALAVLAEYPQGPVGTSFLQQIFAAQDDPFDAVGAARVQLTHRGWWQDVIIDTYIPVVPRRPGAAAWIPAGVRPTARFTDAWPCLVEKAYAKVVGGYNRLSGRGATAVLSDLTGCPVEQVDPRDGVLFTDILERYHRGCVVLLEAQHGWEAAEGEALGLAAGRSYTVLQALHEDGHELLHLRNPWVHEQPWGGAMRWGRGLWTQHLRRACHVPDDAATVGTFMVTWAEAQRLFAAVTVLHPLPEAGEVRLSLPFSPHPAYALEVHLSAPARLFISCHRVGGDAVSDPFCLTLFTPAGTGTYYTTREDREPPPRGCPVPFTTVYELHPHNLPHYILLSAAPGLGVPPDEAVCALHYTPLSPGAAVTGDVLLRSATPFLKAVAMGCRGALVNLAGAEAPLVKAWAQVRGSKAEPHPYEAQRVNHVVL